MSEGDSNITEKGSFFRPSVYGELRLGKGNLKFTPRIAFGSAGLIGSRWNTNSPQDTSYFERDRLINTYSVDIGYSFGIFEIGGTAQWWVINPWFFVYPETFGDAAVGMRLGAEW
jgi:hypothetical protein